VKKSQMRPPTGRKNEFCPKKKKAAEAKIRRVGDRLFGAAGKREEKATPCRATPSSPAKKKISTAGEEKKKEKSISPHKPTFKKKERTLSRGKRKCLFDISSLGERRTLLFGYKRKKKKRDRTTRNNTTRGRKCPKSSPQEGKRKGSGITLLFRKTWLPGEKRVPAPSGREDRYLQHLRGGEERGNRADLFM